MKNLKLCAVFAFGLIIYSLFFIVEIEGLSHNAWLYFSIFCGLILGLILEPISPAFLGLIAVTIAVVFKVGAVGSGLDSVKAGDAINWGLSGFSNAVVWLIFAAFSIGVGFAKTGLGSRIALWLVKKLGKNTLGLGYAIAIIDGILAPFIPSNAARSGGTVYPIVTSIAPMFDSHPDKNSRKIGAYLIWVGLSASCVTSSMFLTGQAPNPLALSLISKSGVGVVDWFSWFLAFLPVGIILFILTPLLCYYIYPPEVKGSSEVSRWAQDKYNALGKITRKEIYMIAIALCGLILWIGSGIFGINATTTALIVIILMISLKVISWNDFLENKQAWSTLCWFATLVAMAGGLKNVGFLDWLSHQFDGIFSGFSSPIFAVILLLLLFSWFRYFFASGTAYVTATMMIFVSLAQSIPNINIEIAMLILCLPMGFMGIITPYGTGCSPLFFGSRYIKGPQFFLLGGIFGAIYLAIFIIVGIPYIQFIAKFLTFN